MNDRQLTVCAIALFADGFDHEQISKALDLRYERCVELVTAGGNEQFRGTMGPLKNCPYGKDRVVSRRDDQGNVAATVSFADMGTLAPRVPVGAVPDLTRHAPIRPCVPFSRRL